MERLPSGVHGLDELIEGGFPAGRVILVSGGCGSGKTIFGMQYIYQGAKEYKEPGVFVTLDERPPMIRQDMMRFGWDVDKLEKKNLLALVDASSARAGIPSEERFSLPEIHFDVDRLLLKIMQISDKIGAKRVVIDSTSGLGLHLATDSEIRKTILKMSYMLMRAGVTSVITSEIPEQAFGSGPMLFSKYGVEEYVADGVITLHYLGIGTETNRSLFIRKMRGTKHAEDLMPLEITPKGLVIKTAEEAYKI